MRWRLKSPALRLFTQPFLQAQIKENIKDPCHWHLRGEFTGDRWIPCTSNAENISIWWRHHAVGRTFVLFFSFLRARMSFRTNYRYVTVQLHNIAAVKGRFHGVRNIDFIFYNIPMLSSTSTQQNISSWPGDIWLVWITFTSSWPL